MRAEIIAIGSELLTPHRLDTNSLYLTEKLNQLGIRVARKTIVGDNREELRAAFHEAMTHADVIISIGGLGPTEDDVTREVVAEVLQRGMTLNEDVLEKIRERFRRFGRTMPDVNSRQAMVIDGGEILANKLGTAPGLWIESDGRVVVLLPGPPNELEAMFEREVERRLARRSSGLRLYKRVLRVTGMPESELDARIAPIYKEYSGVETTILAARGETQIHPQIWSADEAAATRILDELVTRIRPALGDHVFTISGDSLEEIVAALLTANGATVATAESCTGGLLAERLTRIPGSSNYFIGGAVCYSNEMKTEFAGVPKALINAHGAVSSEVAIALARGIRSRVGATIGIGITGVAGPDGGTPEKPVGTVHIALDSADAGKSREKEFHFPGERETVRWSASQTALDWLRRYFLPKESSR